MDPAPYVGGDVFDAVMFYQLYRPAKYFFSKSDFSIDARQFADSLKFQWNRLLKPFRYSMMNVATTHDSPRLLTCFYNQGKYKYHAKPNEDTSYKTGKPDQETYQRVKLYLIHQFTNIGAPHIWNGEEMGMWGADDPYNRKPLWWKEFTFQPETRTNFQPGKKLYDKVAFDTPLFNFYKKLIRIRKENPVLSNGSIDFITAEGKTLIYKRYDKKTQIWVLFNLDTKKQSLKLPEKRNYFNLLDGKIFYGNSFTINSLSGAILKIMDK